jgi:hypothetical protein
MQNRDGSGGARAKGAGRHLRRTVGGDEVAATGTADGMIVMRGDIGAHDREIPHILGLHRTGIPAHGLQGRLAGRAGVRIVIAHLVDMIRVGALVARMPWLSTSLPPTLPARRTRGCGGRIDRRRFGRVLGMLIEPRFESGHMLPEIHILLLELRNLLLLERNDRQQRSEKLPHCQWGCGPVLGENTRWWRLQIHRGSMLGVGAAVKSAGSDRACGGLVNGYVRSNLHLYPGFPITSFPIRVRRHNSSQARVGSGHLRDFSKNPATFST